MPGYRPWIEEDDQRLLELKAAGKSPHVIAKELNRTAAAIVARIAFSRNARNKAASVGSLFV
jgi:hypothetical protein